MVAGTTHAPRTTDTISVIRKTIGIAAKAFAGHVVSRYYSSVFL